MAPPGDAPRLPSSIAPVRTPRPVLGDRLGGHDNALNFLRLVLAGLVIFGHGAALGGFEGHDWHDLSGTAVDGFFALSGYLIAGSRARTTVRGFLWRRALRIYPAFWAALLGTAFLAAPLTAALGHEEWISHSSAAFVVHNATLHIGQWGIESLLLDVPYPRAWNGSLWSLWYEGAAYVATAVVFMLAAVRRHPLPWFVALLSAVLVLQVMAHGPLDVTTNMYLHALRLAGFFLAGMTLWAVRARLPLATWLGVPSLVVVLICRTWEAPWCDALMALPLAYSLLWLSAVLPVRIGARTDLSYGTCVYAFPIQQLLATAGFHTVFGYWGYCLAGLAMTVPVAWLSWRLLEKPMMRWKSLVR